MQNFNYTLKTENGLHARPAGLLVTHIRHYPCDVSVKLGEKKADGKRLVSLMSLGAKQGDTVHFELSGEGEVSCRDSLLAFCEEHL